MATRTFFSPKTALFATLAILGLAATPGFPQSAAAVPAASSGVSDAPSGVSDYPGKPAPILLSPFAQASLAAAAEGAPSVPSAVLPGPPDLETESQRKLRLTAATTASVVGILFNVHCTEAHPLSVMACPGAANGF
jgi:hypothetical protein